MITVVAEDAAEALTEVVAVVEVLSTAHTMHKHVVKRKRVATLAVATSVGGTDSGLLSATVQPLLP